MTPTGAPVPAKSGFQRLAGVLFAPAETFADIARKPDILVPLLTIVIISLITAVINTPRFDWETMFRDQMAHSGRNMSSADMERALPMMMAFGKVMSYSSPLFSLIVTVIVAAVLLFAFRLMGGEGTFKQAFSVTLYAWLPWVVFGIILTIILFTRDAISPDQIATAVRSNPAFLADMQTQRPLFAFLSSLDIFTVWSMFLFITGFSYVSGFSKGKSAAIIISLWVVLVVFKVGFAALAAMRAGA